MFPRQDIFYFRRRFQIIFLKMSAPAVPHFNIARPMTSTGTVPGTQTV